jgi:hypothetical protein
MHYSHERNTTENLSTEVCVCFIVSRVPSLFPSSFEAQYADTYANLCLEHRMKIEIVHDSDVLPGAAVNTTTKTTAVPSLLSRIAPAANPASLAQRTNIAVPTAPAAVNGTAKHA